MAPARSRNCPFASVVEMQMRAVRADFLDGREKRHVGARAAGIIELPRAVLRRELLRHAPDRRDADAAGEQHDMLGIFHQRKIVARRADLKRVADFQLVENVTRATAACGIELDGDDVAVRIGARIEQRELPDQSVRQMNVDVRAGLVGRKLAAVGPPERVNIRVARGVLNIAQHHVDQRVAGVLGGGRGSG